MAYTKAEQETTIIWDAENKTARIYTANPATMRKLDHLAEEFPDVYRITWTEPGDTAKRYEVDSALVRFAKPASEARREAGRRLGLRNRVLNSETHDVSSF